MNSVFKSFTGPSIISLPSDAAAYRMVIEDCPNLRTFPPGLQAQRVQVSRCPRLEEIPSEVRIEELSIEGCSALARLPEGLSASSLTIQDCPNLSVLPEGLAAKILTIRNCPNLRSLPAGLRCWSLTAPDSAFVELPGDIFPMGGLNLSGSRFLRRLPDQVRCERLILQNCPSLVELSDRLEAEVLDLSGSTRWAWPELAFWEVEWLILSDCWQITDLPEWLLLDGWLEVGGTSLTGWSDWFRDRGVRLRWRGVEVDERVAFHPQELTGRAVLAERNSEVRRVMIERMGFERFIAEVTPKVLDVDQDRGGERRLLRVRLPGEKDLVLVSVICPSTGRHYLIRVPPNVQTGREAVAWVSGFEQAAEYEPLVET